MTNTADCPAETESDEFIFCLPKLRDRKNEDGTPALRLLIYTGNLDMSCGVKGMDHILYHLDWSHGDDWQKLDRTVWAAPRGKIKGFYKTLENLTQIVIPCSGHLVPISQPENSLEMAYNFVFEREFSTYKPLPLKPEIMET
ncbi:MAG: hypothetical protein SWO11_14320 [Thermodesulfobacteriota bacterium]|nr:hypothetical protein [Thermodesulfobacteriota bacterium]